MPRQAFYLWSGMQLELGDFIGAADGEEALIEITSIALRRIAKIYETTQFRQRMAAGAQTLIERLRCGHSATPSPARPAKRSFSA